MAMLVCYFYFCTVIYIYILMVIRQFLRLLLAGSPNPHFLAGVILNVDNLLQYCNDNLLGEHLNAYKQTQ